MTAKERRELLAYFDRNGYIRLPKPARRRAEASKYKKGCEVRMVAYDLRELRRIRALLAAAELTIASAHRKANRWIQPVYGRFATDWFQRESKKFRHQR